MNLIKINSSLNKYIEMVKDIKVPDVYELYQIFGEDIMARKIYKFEETENKEYFNKSIFHKKYNSYIGLPQKDFYSEDILDFDNINREYRLLVVKGNNSANNKLTNSFIEKIINTLHIEDFVIDCFYNNEELQKGIYKINILEMNEIHLSSLNPEQLDFVYQNIL